MKEKPINEYQNNDNEQEYSKEEMKYLWEQAHKGNKEFKEKWLAILNQKLD